MIKESIKQAHLEFLNGILSVLMEFIIAIAISALLLMYDAINKVLSELAPTNNTDMFMQAIFLSVILMGIFNMIANFIFGFTRPVNAMFNILGQLFMLALLYTAMIAYDPSIFYNIVISIIMVLIGIALRIIISCMRLRSEKSFYY